MSNKPLRILVVEDDFFVKAEIIRALKRLGHAVVGEASNGRGGVEKTVELRPDVVLMDIGMNEMDGIEAATIIQQRQPTPMIFLTAHESKDMVELASKAGASFYLTKPPNSSEIGRALIIALARHNDIMDLRRMNEALEKKTVELEQALAEIKTLRGIVPICCYCKQIRNDKGFWDSVENYIANHTEARLSHGVCPECLPKAYKEAGIEDVDPYQE